MSVPEQVVPIRIVPPFMWRSVRTKCSCSVMGSCWKKNLAVSNRHSFDGCFPTRELASISLLILKGRFLNRGAKSRKRTRWGFSNESSSLNNQKYTSFSLLFKSFHCCLVYMSPNFFSATLMVMARHDSISILPTHWCPDCGRIMISRHVALDLKLLRKPGALRWLMNSHSFGWRIMLVTNSLCGSHSSPLSDAPSPTLTPSSALSSESSSPSWPSSSPSLAPSRYPSFRSWGTLSHDGAELFALDALLANACSSACRFLDVGQQRLVSDTFRLKGVINMAEISGHFFDSCVGETVWTDFMMSCSWKYIQTSAARIFTTCRSSKMCTNLNW